MIRTALKRTLWGIILLTGLGAAGWAAADQPARSARMEGYLVAQHGQGVPWQRLSPEERRALGQHRGRWERYSPETQQRLRRGAQRYLEMPPERRQQLRRQQERYRQLSPEERRRLREQYRREHR